MTVNGVQKGPLTLAQQDELKQYQLNVDQWTLSIKGVMHEAMNEPATTSAAAPQNIPNNPTQQNEQSAHTKNMNFYVGTNTEINSNGTAGTSGSLHYDGAVMVTQASVNAAMQLPVPEIPSFCRV
ncbi:unnamed protein product [Toxocara canis]|uniref:Pepsin inhibitor-3-like repeated domain-containing protein n=1 Tax=Toxocara canis TaxID=6265 RepID=A0A3P7H756_TOXCA|nr:unnamed protein product [Toxocara canis]